MEKVNLNIPATALNGEPLKENGNPIYLNELLAGIIMMDEARDNTVMQRYELAIKLYGTKGDVELQPSERDIIRKACESGKMRVLVAAQILRVIN